jgi:hypothetical protein
MRNLSAWLDALQKRNGDAIQISDPINGYFQAVIEGALWTAAKTTVIRTPLSDLRFDEISLMKSGFE